MDGYEQMLEIDRITVEYGVSEEELMQLMASARRILEPKQIRFQILLLHEVNLWIMIWNLLKVRR